MNKIVYLYDDKNYLKKRLILDKSDISPSGYWNIPNQCTAVTSLKEKDGFKIKWNGSEWEYEEIPKEPEPPEPTQGEKNQEQANTAKSELRNLAINAMMATLAGGDITAQKTEYQSNIMALSDDVALLIPEVYPVWSADSVKYKKDDRVTYNGVLYKVLTDHISQASWTPTDAPSLFVKILTSDNEILDWEQPSADNAYMKGDKVRYNGKVYESLIDNNVWAPDAYPVGWKEIEVA